MPLPLLLSAASILAPIAQGAATGAASGGIARPVGSYVTPSLTATFDAPFAVGSGATATTAKADQPGVFAATGAGLSPAVLLGAGALILLAAIVLLPRRK